MWICSGLYAAEVVCDERGTGRPDTKSLINKECNNGRVDDRSPASSMMDFLSASTFDMSGCFVESE